MIGEIQMCRMELHVATVYRQYDKQLGKQIREKLLSGDINLKYGISGVITVDIYVNYGGNAALFYCFFNVRIWFFNFLAI